jgi:hypothetical protein
MMGSGDGDLLSTCVLFIRTMRDLTTACWEGWRVVHSVWICEWLAGRSKLDVDTQFQTLH